MPKRRLATLHMVVLAWFAENPLGCAEDAAADLRWPVAALVAICRDLCAAGLIDRATVQ